MVNIGKKIKQLRLKNQMTQEEVAARTDLSAAYISQLETGKTSINVDTLNSLVIVLGSTLSEFFNEEVKDLVIYKKNEVYKVTSEDYNIDWLINDSQKRSIEPIIVKVFKNSESEAVQVFNGESFGYVLSGSCYLLYNQTTHKLEEGDSFYLACNHEHKIVCKDEETKVLWITTPPYF